MDAEIPVDFVVDGVKVVNAVGPEFNRLWILTNATLMTHGNDLAVDVKQILAGDNAAIDTTPPGAWAAPLTPGKSGGLVYVKAISASGKLKIIAAGQGGGTGARGGAGGAGGKGAKGSKGETGREYNDACERHGCVRTVCARQPGNGGQGAQGAQGLPGLGGYPGGNSATVVVDIASPTNFEVVPIINPGAGGAGGIGGAGGPGGPGGNPGDAPSPCPSARTGAGGPQGDVGPVGPQGPSGNAQPICLKLGASFVGDCKSFENMTR